MNQFLNSVHELLLGKEADLKVRRLSLIFAITGFLLHLLLWLAYKMEVLDIGGASPELLDSPLDALYTPFSVLLAYEVYQLIRAIPESFSTAVGKQFEIVTLLVVRDIFKQLSDLDFSGGWSIDSELKFIIVECFTFVILFITSLIYRANSSTEMKLDFQNEDLVKFVQNKRIIALFLLGTYAIIALFSILLTGVFR